MSSVTQNQEFFDPAAAALFACVSQSTVRRWMNSGRLKTYRPCENKVLVSRSELRQMIESSLVVPPSVAE
jgi:hypothetical protein